MFTHPDITGRIVRERQRERLAAARQRQLGRQHGRQASKAADIAAAVIRRLASVIAEPSQRSYRYSSRRSLFPPEPRCPVRARCGGGTAERPSRRAART